MVLVSLTTHLYYHPLPPILGLVSLLTYFCCTDIPYYFSAFVVRYITKRYIGDYENNKGTYPLPSLQQNHYYVYYDKCLGEMLEFLQALV